MLKDNMKLHLRILRRVTEQFRDTIVKIKGKLKVYQCPSLKLTGFVRLARRLFGEVTAVVGIVCNIYCLNQLHTSIRSA